MNVTHIVGWQGTGKSTLAALMVADLEKRGARCAVVDSDEFRVDFNNQVDRVVSAHSGVDHLFLEWMPNSFAGGADALRGARVIEITDLPKLATDVAGQHNQES